MQVKLKLIAINPVSRMGKEEIYEFVFLNTHSNQDNLPQYIKVYGTERDKKVYPIGKIVYIGDKDGEEEGTGIRLKWIWKANTKEVKKTFTYFFRSTKL